MPLPASTSLLAGHELQNFCQPHSSVFLEPPWGVCPVFPNFSPFSLLPSLLPTYQYALATISQQFPLPMHSLSTYCVSGPQLGPGRVNSAITLTCSAEASSGLPAAAPPSLHTLKVGSFNPLCHFHCSWQQLRDQVGGTLVGSPGLSLTGAEISGVFRKEITDLSSLPFETSRSGRLPWTPSQGADQRLWFSGSTLPGT